ncbi:MAG: hypothetical protein ABI650_08390 [Dokdonella sp.]
MTVAKILAQVSTIGLLGACVSALAADGDDRFTLRLGAMYTQGSGELYGSGELFGEPASFRESADFGSKEVSPRVDGVFRFSARNRLIFDYFGFKKDLRATLPEDVEFEGDTIPAGSAARLQSRFQLASLIYDYSVIDTADFSAGLEIGVEYAKIDGSARADIGDVRYAASVQRDGFAPVVGLRMTATPGEHWLISAQAQYLDAGWGNFDYDGNIRRANAIVEYRPADNFGVFGGYDWFDVEYSRSGADASGGISLVFKGPIAGVTLAF